MMSSICGVGKLSTSQQSARGSRQNIRLTIGLLLAAGFENRAEKIRRP